MKLRSKAVLFDLVGTLIYVKDSVGAVYSIVANQHGINADSKKLDDSFHKLIQTKKQPTGGNEDEKKWWKETVLETFALSGCDLKEKSNEIYENIFVEFTKKNTWGVYPDVVPLFKKLKSDRLKIGLISNFDNRLEAILKEIELYDFFDSLAYSGKVGISKPDHRIFQFVLNELNIIPEEAIYVGDSINVDYNPACKLNLEAVLINRDQSILAAKGIKTISNLNQISDFLIT